MTNEPLGSSAQSVLDRSLGAASNLVLQERARLNEASAGNLEKRRIVAVLAAANGSHNLLAGSIPALLAQSQDSGLGLDLMVGLNDGFRCDELLSQIARDSNSSLVFLFARPRAVYDRPGTIITESGVPGWQELQPCGSGRNRIFAIVQPADPYSRGKIRILGDIYTSLLTAALNNGCRLPETCLWLDAESHLVVQPRGSSRPDNPLALLFNEVTSDPDLELLGTRVRFAVYPSDGVNPSAAFPDSTVAVPAIYEVLNAAHGRARGVNWLPGGGTLGKTTTAVALVSVIARLYPGTRVEDCQGTIIAQHAQIKWSISETIESTNRCFDERHSLSSATQSPAYMAQLGRWLAGLQSLRDLYGDAAVSDIIPIGNIDSIFSDKRQMDRIVSKGGAVTSRRAALSMPVARWQVARAMRNARRRPDTLWGEDSDASWREG